MAGQKVNVSGPVDVGLDFDAKGQAAIVGSVRPFTFDTGWRTIQGIGTGAAYATGDAVGLLFPTGSIPSTGRIETVYIIDEDKEELACDLALFDSSITVTADNAAFDVAVADMTKQVGVIPITNADYVTYANSSYATVRNVGHHYTTSGNGLLVQWVTRGAPNIAASKRLLVRFLGVPTDGAA